MKNKYIVKEYLAHFFSFEELATYLEITTEEVEKVINNKEQVENILGKNGFAKLKEYQKRIKMYQEHKDSLKISDEIDKKTYEIANYIIMKDASLGNTALHFNIGKSTVHDYIEERLPYVSIELYKKVFDIKNSKKSLSVDYKKHRDEAIKAYELLKNGYTIEEIAFVLGVNRNKVERDLSKRFNGIDEMLAIDAKNQLANNRSGKKR